MFILHFQFHPTTFIKAHFFESNLFCFDMILFRELDNNQLTGTIPSSIGNLLKLQYLFLDDNQLTGTIPSSIENLVKLSEFALYNNSFSGVIPQAVCQIDYPSIFPNNGVFTCPLPTCCASSLYCSADSPFPSSCSNHTKTSFQPSTTLYCCYYESLSGQPAPSLCSSTSPCPVPPKDHSFFSSTPTSSCSQCNT